VNDGGSGLLAVLGEAAAAVQGALGRLEDWGPAGTRPGQYRSDLVADEADVAVLDRAGLDTLSQESGLHHPDAVECAHSAILAERRSAERFLTRRDRR